MTHIGREWITHNIEDNCPCPKAPCGLVDMANVSIDCEHHPIGRAKTIRQSHNITGCPATPKLVAIEIEKAYEHFCMELDNIASRFEQASDVFGAAVEDAIGDQPAYTEWMQETWEREV